MHFPLYLQTTLFKVHTQVELYLKPAALERIASFFETQQSI